MMEINDEGVYIRLSVPTEEDHFEVDSKLDDEEEEKDLVDPNHHSSGRSVSQEGSSDNDAKSSQNSFIV